MTVSRVSVASFTDAWIETQKGNVKFVLWHVASFTDAWIETVYTECYRKEYTVASFTDAWIETALDHQMRCF